MSCVTVTARLLMTGDMSLNIKFVDVYVLFLAKFYALAYDGLLVIAVKRKA